MYPSLEYQFEATMFARELIRWRTERRLTLTDVAEMLGGMYTASYLAILEQGIITGGVPLRTFLLVCNLIDKSPFMFFSLVQVWEDEDV